MTDIWIGLAEAVPLDPGAHDFAVAYIQVLAPVDDRLELVAAAEEALAEEGLELVALTDAEPVRDRFEESGLSDEYFSLALDAALDDEAQLGTWHVTDDDTPAPTEPMLRAQLAEALEQRALVCVETHHERGEGYVVAVGARWVLLHALDSAVSLGGFTALPVGLVAEIEPLDREETLTPRFLELRRMQPAAAPAVSLDGVEELLRTAQERYALLSIHTEAQQQGAHYVGRVQSLDGDTLLLETVDRAGDWDETEELDCRAITRVSFGGPYEEALAAVAGAEPFTP